MADLQQREQTAASQRQRLTMMGPEGRLRGQFALMAGKSYGVGMLPQDMIGAGTAYAPETFRNLAEQEGGQYFNEARQFAPEEFRDDLPTVRSQVDAAGRRVQGQKQAARESSAGDVERAMETGGDKLVKSLVDVIGKLFERMANDVAELKKDQGTAQSYNPPRG